MIHLSKVEVEKLVLLLGMGLLREINDGDLLDRMEHLLEHYESIYWSYSFREKVFEEHLAKAMGEYGKHVIITEQK